MSSRADGGFGGAERGDALVFARAGEAIEIDALFEAHGNAVALGELDDGVDAFAVAAARDDDAVEAAAGGERFFDGVEAGDPVHRAVLVALPSGLPRSLRRLTVYVYSSLRSLKT